MEPLRATAPAARFGYATLFAATIGALALFASGCPRAVCGNARLDGAEQCDDGNTDDTDTCTSSCLFNVCGDGLVGPVEECDEGIDNNDAAPDACRTTCEDAGCGDFVTDTGEECDGEANCTATCTISSMSCGNGTIDAGEECDNGALNSDTMPNACRTTCVLPLCGDSVIDTAEECDDGNTTAGDGCDDSCQAEVGCGNGVVDGAEECDDDNTVSGDGCDALCFDESCGDGIINDAGTEQCEPPSAGDCDAACQVLPDACGAGVTITEILPGTTTPGTTMGAGSFDLSCGPSAGAGEQVYVAVWDGFSGPADLVFELDSAATTFDSVLEVRAAPCLGGVQIDCDDIFPGSGGEVVEVLDAAPGTYYVIVDGFSGMNGSFELDFTIRPIVAAGGTCDPAGVTDRCDAGLTCIDPGVGPICTNAMMMACTAATPLTSGTPATGVIDVADADVFGWDPAGQCGMSAPGSGEDVWVITLSDPLQDLLLSLDPAGTDFDAVLYVRSPGCEIPSDEIGCNDVFGIGGDALTLLDLPAGDYYVIVDGWDGNVGSYTLNVDVRPVSALGGTCDPAGVTSRCETGLNCVMVLCATPACGDGYLDSGEDCDDGNLVLGDGCDDTCFVEATFEVEVNDTIADVIAGTQPIVSASALFQGNQVLAADVDLFRITLTTYADVSVLTGTDPGLGCGGVDLLDASLQDATGAVLASDLAVAGDECGAVDPAVATGARALPPGDYYAVVDAQLGATSYYVRIVITPVLVINEILADAPSMIDLNCDGLDALDRDEFIELVNQGAGDLDISAWEYWDGELAPLTLRLTFPSSPPTIVPVGGAVLVFASGGPVGGGAITTPCSWPASVLAFGDDGTGFLNNGSNDAVRIYDGPTTGTLVAIASYVAPPPIGVSMTLSPDLADTDPSQTVAGPYVAHDGVSVAPYSPGFRTDGTPF